MRQILISILCFLPLFGEEIYATFNIQATQSATLSLASNGVIEEIFVEVGDFVEKGEKLLTLKAKDLQENVNKQLYEYMYNQLKNISVEKIFNK